MMLLGIPAAPFLLVFILGPMFGDDLRRSLAISRGNPGMFFHSAISWRFFVLIVLFIGITVRQEWRRFQEKRAVQIPASDVPELP